MNDLREQLQQVLGDTYQLERELSGGMSRVFVAEETALARKVVIKVLPPETAAAVNVARFRREIQLAASLQHPHIVPLLSAGSRGDLLYYVMPLIEGESLRARLLRAGELPVSDVAWILRDAALALAYAHSHGVVHRDIKPDNILLTGKFAVVADFGVAKAVSEATSDSSLTSAGVALGTPAYMAPEQAVADPTTDHRADIYALGVVGYELLTGTPPFTGTSPQMILAAHVTRAPEHVTKQRASVPPALANVIMRCLEKKAADRWQSADELAQHLASIATSGATTPMTTAPYAAVAPAKTGSGRSRRPAIAAAFVLGLAAFGAVAWFAGRGTGGARFDDHRVIVADFENQTRDPTLDPIGKLASDLLRQGLAQTGVADAVEAPDGKATEDPNEAKPGLIIRGRYYREGDNVRIQAEILDARTSRVARALSSVTGPAANPTLALEQLRPRVLGAIATLNDPLIANWARKTTEPPLYEAYLAYRTGIEAEIPRAGTLSGQEIGAARNFERASQMDSTFILPLVETQFAANDSIKPALLSLERNRDRLTPLDRALVDFAIAHARLDNDASVKAGRVVTQLAPDPVLLVAFAEVAINGGYPHEAAAALAKADPQGQLKIGWGVKTDALHLIGDLQGELAAVKRARELGVGAEYDDAQIYAALGKTSEVNTLVEDRLRRPSRGEENPAALMMFAAREYRAHGFNDASREITNRALAWYESRPASESTEARQFNVVLALLHAGRWSDVRDRIARMTRQLKWTLIEEPGVLGLLGRVAAHMGDTALAQSHMEKLKSMPPMAGYRGNSYQRALIAAALGQKEQAAVLLRQAFAEGWRYEPYLHREIGLQAMQNYPPMRELLWPKR